MNVKEYIKKKNAIIFNITGITLVPEDQIDNTEYEGELSSDDDDSSICPYCVVYGDDNCYGCPMAEVGNHCDDNEESTYQLATNELLEKTGKRRLIEIPEIVELVNQWNEELGH